MRYFDTSFIIPMILPEKTSNSVIELAKTIPTGETAISHGTRVEFVSAVALKVRIQTLTTSEAEKATQTFDTLINESSTSSHQKRMILPLLWTS